MVTAVVLMDPDIQVFAPTFSDLKLFNLVLVYNFW